MITDLILYIQTNLSDNEQIILVLVTILITLALYKLDRIIDRRKEC